MYYRKYFSGSVDATTTTNQYYMGLDKVATGTSRKSGHIKNRADVLGNALVSTFKDIGFPNAYWDSTAGYFFIDKTNSLCGIYITVDSSYAYCNTGYRGSTYITATSATSSSSTDGSSYGGLFSVSGTSAADYAFYITIKGEPKGVFSVHIGSYTDHSSESRFFYICMGKDKRDNSNTIGFTFATSSSPTNFRINNYATAETLSNYNSGTSWYQSVSFALGTSKLTLKDETIVLIPLFFYLGYLILDNTYFNPGLTEGFYEIDGDIYQAGTYYITKCITEV